MIGDWIVYIINNYSNRTYENTGFIRDWFADEVLENLTLKL